MTEAPVFLTAETQHFNIKGVFENVHTAVEDGFDGSRLSKRGNTAVYKLQVKVIIEQTFLIYKIMMYIKQMQLAVL